ncbi:MAG: two-component regulator propeller domain-containing protein [Bacteroidota bacterium]
MGAYTSRKIPHAMFGLWCILFSIPFLVHAQTQRLAFDYINIKEGLPANGAFDLLQDHQGYIWMCTLNGLVKYDGYQFKIFRGIPNDLTGRAPVGRSFVSALLAKDHKIWVSTLNSGFSAYDPRTEAFINFPNTPDEQGNVAFPRHDIVKEDLAGRIWMYAVSPATGKAKIQFLDPKQDTIVQFDRIHNLGASVNFEGTLVEDSQGGIYIHQSDSGVYKFNETQQRFELFLSCHTSPAHPLSCSRITHLRIDAQDRLWIGTDKGIKIFNLDQSSWAQTTAILGGQEKLLSRPISYTYEDLQGNVWIFLTQKGVVRLNFQDQSVEHFDLSAPPFDQLAIEKDGQIIRPVMEDRRGIWFMNDVDDTRGLERSFFFYDPARQQMESYGERFNFPQNKPNDQPSAFLIDQSGLFWGKLNLSPYDSIC